METNHWCGACAEVTAYVRFDCDDHPEDCVELVCALCGSGLELAPVQGEGRRGRPGRGGGRGRKRSAA